MGHQKYFSNVSLDKSVFLLAAILKVLGYFVGDTGTR
jgi:hypothetical protein